MARRRRKNVTFRQRLRASGRLLKSGKLRRATRALTGKGRINPRAKIYTLSTRGVAKLLRDALRLQRRGGRVVVSVRKRGR